MRKTECRICGSTEARRFGITTYNSIAVPEGVSKKRHLFKCLKCGSITVEPVPTEDQLRQYYDNYAAMNIGVENWHKRNCLPAILELANEIKKGKVLDIGCGRGDLLNMLPSSLEKFGIELSKTASKEAQSKGISVSCLPWETAKFTTTFDLVVALDFLEHVKDPLTTLKKIFSVLKPGGYILIETGNASSLSARALVPDWAYTSVFGHICVLTTKALVSLAKSTGFQRSHLIVGYHSLLPLRQRSYRWFKAYGFRAFRLVYCCAKPVLKKIEFLSSLYEHPPPSASLVALPDHMIFVGRKPLNSL